MITLSNDKKWEYLESRGIPPTKTIEDVNMTIFILTNENIITGEKIIKGAYTSEDKVLEVMDSLPTNDFDWAYDYEEIELE